MNDHHRVSRMLTTAKMAELLGGDWTADTMRDLVKREGIGVKRGGRWYVTRTQIRAAWPELAVELEIAIAEGGG